MRDERLLHTGERLDDLQIKGYEIIQHPGRFCFGMDAVLLSSFAKVKKGERALDLGTGRVFCLFCLRQRIAESIIRGLRFSRRARTWQGEALRIMVWNQR